MNSQINSEGNIILHFDTRQGLRVHCNTLISSLKAVETAAKSVAENLFGKECKIKLTDIYIEEGSWKQIILMTLNVIDAVIRIVTVRYPETIKSLLEQYSRPPIEQYLEQKQHKKLIADVATDILATPAKEMRTVFNNCTFNNCTFPNFPLKKVIEDKNKFYQSAREDENILGIEFKDEHEFPINRENIDKYIDNTLPEESTTIAYKELILVSPVLDRNSQKKWSFKTSDSQTQSYEMQDPSFLEKTLKGDYPFKEGTRIEAKICIQEEAGKTVHSILDVYTVDGKEEKPKPKDFELSAIINNPTDISTQQTLSF